MCNDIKPEKVNQCFCVHNCQNGCELKKGYARIHEKIDSIEEIIKKRIKQRNLTISANNDLN